MDTASVDLLSLIGADVHLKKVAATGGGEWAGPCPFCGGAEKRAADRFRVWPAEGRFWCRRCQRSGDAIDYVRERHGLDFGAALERLGLEGSLRHRTAEAAGRSGTANAKGEGVVLWGVRAGTAAVNAKTQRREGAMSSAWDGSSEAKAPNAKTQRREGAVSSAWDGSRQAKVPNAKTQRREGAMSSAWEGSRQAKVSNAETQRCKDAMSSAWEALPLPRHEPLEPPSDAWQGRAIDFCSECIDRLWSKEGARVRAWLVEKRGLSEQTIMDGSLGYNPGQRRDAPEVWGFGADHKPVWLPRGITIPWVARGHVWRVNIRRPEGDPKYAAAAGSATALYRSNTLAPGWAAVLVEGELDALTIWQHAGGIIAAVATGSTTAARRPRWLAPLAACDVVLVAFDSDAAGEEAAAYWLNILPKARRWRPYFGKDANGLATGGGDVAAWILDGLGSAPW